MNGFLAFPSRTVRDQFLDELQAEEPAIAAKLFAPRTRPDCLAENLSPAEIQRLLQRAQGLAQWFGDVQFTPAR